MKTKFWIAIIGGAAAVCLALSVMLLGNGADAAFAQVYSQGRLVHTLDLSRDVTLTVESPLGTNTVEVRGGKLAVTEATCPDGHCMARGFCGGGAQIVCLPNRLVIRFTETGGIDAAVG